MLAPGALKVQRAWRIFFLEHSLGSGRLELDIIQNHDAVVDDGDACVGCLLALAIVAGGAEIDVVGQPRQGWQAQVDRGGLDAIDRAAFFTPFQAKRIQDLDLVAIL